MRLQTPKSAKLRRKRMKERPPIQWVGNWPNTTTIAQWDGNLLFSACVKTFSVAHRSEIHSLVRFWTDSASQICTFHLLLNRDLLIKIYETLWLLCNVVIIQLSLSQITALLHWTQLGPIFQQSTWAVYLILQPMRSNGTKDGTETGSRPKYCTMGASN